MLRLHDVSIALQGHGKAKNLLVGVTAAYPLEHLGAIIGPSGCGKTTLLRLIAGIAHGHETGEIRWRGRRLNDEDFHASEVAYVPQFGIAHEELTARECVNYALRLRVPSERQARHEVVNGILEECGVSGFQHQLVRTLSGGERRRLALAMELTSKPDVLLCDEVTSGLDPQAENEITQLLKRQAHDAGRLVLCVTHSLDHLECFDSVTMLYGGYLIYHGNPAKLAVFFEVQEPNEVYPALAARTASEWAARWDEQRIAIMATETTGIPRQTIYPPGIFCQFVTLLRRRVVIFSRSPGQILLQLGFIFGFPAVIALFAWQGLPAVENLSMGLEPAGLKQFQEAKDFLVHSSKVGSLVSGIVMFQVILLALMGANHAGREIAVERGIFEKEKLSGLSPLAYVASKTVFLSLLVITQSAWMGLFVHRMCDFPGELVLQVGYLCLMNAAVTALCLGISSMMRTAEQASLVSIYLVGFQLPLSGAVLALPEPLGAMVRPFISAYWSWSGILQTLKQERYYDIVQSVVQSPLAEAGVCAWVLVVHIAVGLLIAWLGCESRQR